MDAPNQASVKVDAMTSPSKAGLRQYVVLAAVGIVSLCLIAVGVYLAGSQIWAEYHYRAALRELERAISSQRPEHLEKAQAHLTLCLEVWQASAETHFLTA